MRKLITHLFLLATVMLTSIATADQTTYTRWENDQVVVSAAVNIWLRASEPSGLFCSRGKQLGVIKQGQNVKVRKYIIAKCGILFKYDYLEVEVINPGPNQPPWGIVSAVNDDGSPLFLEPIKGEEE